MAVKSAPISSMPGAAHIMLREMSPTSASGAPNSRTRARSRETDCLDGGVEVLRLRLLQVLRLEAGTGPAASAGAVKAQRAAQPVISVETGEQGIKLPRGGATAIAAELEQVSTSSAGALAITAATDGLPKFVSSMPMLAQEAPDSRHLVRARDGAAGQFADGRH